MPDIKPGDNPKAVAAKALGALAVANRRLEDDAVWYEEVRDGLSRK